MDPLRILFLCTGNSARSQMAEALLRHMTHGRAEVFSAGTEPKSAIHPAAKAVLEEKFGIDTSGLQPKHLSRFEGQAFDYVITVCDRAAESCPVMPGDPERIHWSFPDPAALKPDEQRKAFEKVAAELAGRMRIWMALPAVRQRLGV
jgi:ArsR family transcriptional regulator, arsenate/arsenite/antimonite-responsive transcriptional repressor / arsenate reductase (thioredoxin)